MRMVLTGCIVGGAHVVVPKRVILVLVLSILGIFTGIFLAERTRFEQVEIRVTDKNRNLRAHNDVMRSQKEGLVNLFEELATHLEGWKEHHQLPHATQQANAETVQRSAERTLAGINEVMDVLQQKEVELLEKELLLSAQRTELMADEDKVDEMAEVIMLMAARVQELQLPLPEGLEGELFFGSGLVEPIVLADDDDDAEASEAAALEYAADEAAEVARLGGGEAPAAPPIRKDAAAAAARDTSPAMAAPPTEAASPAGTAQSQESQRKARLQAEVQAKAVVLALLREKQRAFSVRDARDASGGSGEAPAVLEAAPAAVPLQPVLGSPASPLALRGRSLVPP